MLVHAAHFASRGIKRGDERLLSTAIPRSLWLCYWDMSLPYLQCGWQLGLARAAGPGTRWTHAGHSACKHLGSFGMPIAGSSASQSGRCDSIRSLCVSVTAPVRRRCSRAHGKASSASRTSLCIQCQCQGGKVTSSRWHGRSTGCQAGGQHSSAAQEQPRAAGRDAGSTACHDGHQAHGLSDRPEAGRGIIRAWGW